MICSRHFARERLDVGAVGDFRIGHDRGRVGVHQHDLVAVGAQRLAGLRAGIVEFAGLADDDRAGADDQDFLDVGALWHVSRRTGLARDDLSSRIAHEAADQLCRASLIISLKR